ncbi:MAG: hypothetical protein GY906_22275 [bacterium]|nr:hypothetical protein [bacterium]
MITPARAVELAEAKAPEIKWYAAQPASAMIALGRKDGDEYIAVMAGLVRIFKEVKQAEAEARRLEEAE